MPNPLPDPTTRVMQLLWPGAFATQAVHAAARLGVADTLADGPRSAEDIANAAGANADFTRRLLRALISLEIFREDDDGRFHNTPLSEALQRGSPARAWAMMLGAPFVWRPWGQLYDAVMTGGCAFDAVFATPFDEYMAAHPEEADAYNTAMDVNASMAAASVVAAYDFSAYETIVDVGGGRGALLAAILNANPKSRGVLFDLPGVVANRDTLRIARFGERCAVEGGDFFVRVPGGDALVLKSIIHALSDAQAAQVLRNCRNALNPKGRLMLIETILDAAGAPNPQKALMDLMMLTLTNGHERTAADFEALLPEAGFELTRVVPTDRGNAVIEAATR
ncbi:MAG: hypothetical protein KDA32_10205 [Phycisphaerales bacterium]|nr:hypothetical protein [Phycisphaerales bacterium]